jgi:hypothetical protein
MFTLPFRVTKKTKSARGSVIDSAISMPPATNPLTTITAILIAVFIGGSLWVAVTGLMEKVKLSHELQQVIEVVSAAKDAALAQRLDESKSEDLLATLGRLGSIAPTGEIEGTKTLSNPWGGMVAASTLTGARHFRLETVAPANKCYRLIDLFDHNGIALGLEQITVKDREGSWQNVYPENRASKPNDARLAMVCNNPVQADIILTFSLR